LIDLMWLGSLWWFSGPQPHSYLQNIICFQSNQKTEEQLTLKLAKMASGEGF
jgi:hypothetical protein